MEDLKLIIARNLADLRKSRGMTQVELAEHLNYSDKAVSKWERGESLPDITVLKAIADLFGVTVDYLISAEHEVALPPVSDAADEAEMARIKSAKAFRAHAVITGMSILLVCLIATILFFILWYALPSKYGQWIPFVYALPVSAIVWLVLNSIWFNRRRNYLIISLLMWSLLLAVYLTVLLAGINLWLIFILGIPGQAIILMWSVMKKRRTEHLTTEETSSAGTSQ